MTVIGDAFVEVHPEVSKFASGLQSQLGAINFAQAGAAIGLAIGAAAVVGLAKIGQEFGAVKNQIIRETGLSGDAMIAVFDTVKRVGAQVPGTFKEIATAADELKRRGVPLGAQFDKLTAQEVELAKITGTDLKQNVEDTTAIFNKWGVTLNRQPKLLDEIFKASQQAGVSINAIITPLKGGAAALEQFGFSVDESVALIANFAKAGLNTSQAIFGLRTAFAKLAKEGKDPKQALIDLQAEFKTDPALAMSEALKLFGARGLEMAKAMKDGKLDVKAMLDIISDGRGGILETGEATRTVAEQFTILKNQLLIALQPLASSVWTAFRQTLNDLTPPLEHLFTAFGDLAGAVAPAAFALGVTFVGAMKAVVVVVDDFAAGIQGVADILGIVPAPVLAVVGALGLLALAIKTGFAGDLVLNIGAFLEGLSPVGQIALAAAAAITVLGVVIRGFRGESDQAAQTAGEFVKSMVDTTSTTGVFVAGITSASGAFEKFLNEQNKAGKLDDLNPILTRTGQSYHSLSAVLGGTTGQFDKLKAGLIGSTDGWTDAMKTILAANDVYAAHHVLSGDATKDQKRELIAATELSAALDEQKRAFDDAVKSTISSAQAAGQITPEQARMAEGIRTATTAISGADEATKFLTESINENQKAAAESAHNTAKQSGALEELRREVLAGSITTNDAAQASADFGLELEDTKKIIEDTSAALKKFTDDALAGFGGASTTAIDDWGTRVSDAFNKVIETSKDGGPAFREAQKEMTAALDPQGVVDALNRQTLEMVAFFDNIKRLAADFPNAAAALLADPNKPAAAALANQLVDKPKIAAAFDSAQVTNQQKVKEISAWLQGPGAQILGPAAGLLGDAITNNYKPNFDPPTKAEVSKAQATLDHARASFRFAGGLMSTAVAGAYSEKFLLNPPTQAEIDKAKTTIANSKVKRAGTVAGAAADTAKASVEAYNSEIVKIVDKTSGAVASAVGAFSGEHRVELINSAFSAGRIVGFNFGAGIEQGIGNKIGAVEAAARNIIDRAKAAADKQGKGGSPYQLLAESGQWFTEGFAAGIEQGIPQAVRSAQSLIVQTAASTQAVPIKVVVNAKQTGEEFSRSFAAGVDSGRSFATAAAQQLVDDTASIAGVTVQGPTFAFGDPVAIAAAKARLADLVASDAAAKAAADAAAEAAKTAEDAAKAAQQALEAFVGAAVSALPTSASLISAAGNAIVQASQNVHDALITQTKSHNELAAARERLAAAQRKLFIDVATSKTQAQIEADTRASDAALSNVKEATKAAQEADNAVVIAKRRLAEAQDPGAFIRTQQQANARIRAFQDDLRTLINEGFLDLASDLAKAGPDVAGKLADAFAHSKSKAKAAEAAIDQASAYSDTFSQFIHDNFADQFGVALGEAVTQRQTVSPTIDLKPHIDVAAIPTNLTATIRANLDTSALPAAVAPPNMPDISVQFVPDTTALNAVISSLADTHPVVQVQLSAAIPQITVPVTLDTSALDALAPQLSVAASGSTTNAALTVPSSSTAAQTTTLALDLTINLPDGDTVTAELVVPVPPASNLVQTVKAEVNAT